MWKFIFLHIFVSVIKHTIPLFYMKTSKIRNVFLTFAMNFLLCIPVNIYAQTSTAKILKPVLGNGGYLCGMSDNGLWAVSHRSSEANATQDASPTLINVTTGEETALLSSAEEGTIVGCGAYDVTDDASIVVGNHNGIPAVWLRSSNEWRHLPTPKGWSSGNVNSITPDGKFAVGTCSELDEFHETPVLWDLNNDGAIVETPDIPIYDMQNEDNHQSRFIDISPDGNKILGCLSYSHLSPPSMLYYIYDRTTKTYDPIGFTRTITGNDTVWTAKQDGLLFIDQAAMGAGGKYVSGIAYMVKERSTTDFPTEYQASYLYNVETGEFTIYDEESTDMVSYSVDTLGHCFAATPSSSPLRNWSVRIGNYWYDIYQILKQRYDIDFYAATGFENTGTVIATNLDGTVFAAFTDPLETSASYILTLPEPIEKAAESVDLLAGYTATPTDGAEMSVVSRIKILFDRDIEVVGDKGAAILKNAAGETVKNSLTFQLSTGSMREVSIGFRSTALNKGEKYTVTIPAGVITLPGDASHKNREINVNYTGRANEPVSVVSVSPTENTSLAQLNISTSPVIVTFDTNIAVTDSASATLYQEADGGGISLCRLTVARGDSALAHRIALYPATTQYLYKDVPYRIDIKAGSITDISGSATSGNETISLHYIGAYERELVYDDNTIFADDFNGGLGNFLLYDGDHNTPTAEMADWSFTENLPYSVAWDDDDPSDIFAVSHSMYSPAGKSDDWLSTPQLYLPDEKCSVTFRAQSYRANRNDSLKVIVYACDDVYNVLDDDIVNRFKKEGKVVYAGKETPGRNEGMLFGEWTRHTIQLSEFAGKNVYIAFVNDNDNQSAVFIEKIEVIHEVEYLVSIITDATVENKAGIAIKGSLLIQNEEATYSTLTMKLSDASGKQISEYRRTGLALSEGDTCNFEFPQELPLITGIENEYTIDIDMDGDKNAVKGTIKNLAFSPIKRVVVEEGTGMDCPNCPYGFAAMDILTEAWGDRLIPVAIHTYTGDRYGSGLTGYAEFLGFGGYPTASINRSVASFPMQTVNGRLTNSTEEYPDLDPLWYDIVAQEMSILADAELEIKAYYDAENITVPCSFRFALDAEKLNYDLFFEVIEDGLPGYQRNGVGSGSDILLGEWGAGGSLSASTVYPYTFNDVLRMVVGTSFYGTPGYVPTEVTAGNTYTAEVKFQRTENITDINNCSVVCMMIDANTGRVINAAKAKLLDYAGIDETTADNFNVRVQTDGSRITITTDTPAHIALIGINGVLLDNADSDGETTLDAKDYTGVAVIHITNNRQSIMKKIILK